MKTIILEDSFKGDNDKYFYLYRIVNNINNHFYIGVHTSEKIPDSYTGSGTRLKLAYKKYGKENFTKYILKFFQNSDEMLDNEEIIVDEKLLLDNKCYNLIPGGGTLESEGKCVVIDDQNNIFQVPKDDPQIGVKYVPINTGKIVVLNKDGKHIRISKNEYELNRDKYTLLGTGYKSVKDSDGTTMRVKLDDPRLLTGELVSVVKDTVTVKDKNGNTYRVPKNDPRVKSGELVSCTSGRLTVRDINGNILSVSNDDPRIGTELISINSGRIYINNGIINKMVYDTELDDYIQNGWQVGMIKKGDMTVYREICGKIERKLIYKKDLVKYLRDGWIRGQGKTKPKSGRPKKK